MDTNYVSSYEMKAAQATLLKNVYLWMTVALAITGITALAVVNSPTLSSLLFSGRATFFILLIAELGLVWYVSARIYYGDRFVYALFLIKRPYAVCPFCRLYS